ncbi:uncharacterized protein LOC113368282 [Ctenocephalides felis]|uniref:uncharacterized protein LOC113368282 n=1 Tax=Ctenocephalides felis TaxID=7515 RepID=UPI000E6E17BA|nr:uncharacterized protein LOC113368282 [Ctenocephalides felis]
MNRLAIFFTAVLALGLAEEIEVIEIELPSYLTTCPRNSAELDTCLKQSIAAAVPQLRSGHELLGLRPIDPMELSEFKTGVDAGLMRSKLVAKDFKVHGLSNMVVKDVKSEVTDNSLLINAEVYFPKVLSEGSYKGDSSFGDYQIKSRGIFNVTMYDVTVTWKIEGATEERDGETYMRIKHFRVSPKVGDMKIYASGLIPDEGLNNAAVAFMNQYWQPAFQALLPYAEEHGDQIMTNFVNEMFLRIPFNKLMPVE